MSQDTYAGRMSYLGSEEKPSGWFGPKISDLQAVMTVCVLAATAVLWLLTQSFVVLALGAVAAIVAFKLGAKETKDGDSWVGVKLGVIGGKRAGAAGRWHRELGIPAEVGPLRELTFQPSPLDRPDVVVGFMHHPDKRGSYTADSKITAMLEIEGQPSGLRPVADDDRSADRFSRLMRKFAAKTSPVCQLDLETRVFPAHPAIYERDHLAMLDPDCPPGLQASFEQLAAEGGENTETYRTYATVAFKMSELAQKISGPVTPESMAEAAGDALRDVVRKVENAGMPVLNVLNPAQIAGTVRALYVPSFPIDSPAGMERTVDGWAWPYEAHRDHVVVEGPPTTDPVSGETVSQWFHSVATVPVSAFPQDPVTPRWLSGLVTEVQPSPIRTVKVQYEFIPRAEARSRAVVRLTQSSADSRTAENAGQVSDGVADVSMSVHEQVIQDLTWGRAAGVRAVVHVLVSGRSPEELEAERTQIVTAAEEMGIERLKWQTWRHHTAMTLFAPLGRGFKP